MPTTMPDRSRLLKGYRATQNAGSRIQTHPDTIEWTLALIFHGCHVFVFQLCPVSLLFPQILPVSSLSLLSSLALTRNRFHL